MNTKKLTVIEAQYIDHIVWEDIDENSADTLRYSNDGLLVLIIGKIKTKNWIDDIPNVKVYKKKEIEALMETDNWKSAILPSDGI